MIKKKILICKRDNSREESFFVNGILKVVKNYTKGALISEKVFENGFKIKECGYTNRKVYETRFFYDGSACVELLDKKGTYLKYCFFMSTLTIEGESLEFKYRLKNGK